MPACGAHPRSLRAQAPSTPGCARSNPRPVRTRCGLHLAVIATAIARFPPGSWFRGRLKQAVIARGHRRLSASAMPAARRNPPATIALPPKKHGSRSKMCIEPPRPRPQPCSWPSISASCEPIGQQPEGLKDQNVTAEKTMKAEFTVGYQLLGCVCCFSLTRPCAGPALLVACAYLVAKGTNLFPQGQKVHHALAET